MLDKNNRDLKQLEERLRALDEEELEFFEFLGQNTYMTEEDREEEGRDISKMELEDFEEEEEEVL